MRKIFGIILGFLGVAVVVVGVLMQVDTNKKDQGPKKEIFGHKEVEIKRINNFNQEEVCKNFESVDTYLNVTDYSKISFSYPNCVHEYEYSKWRKNLLSEDSSINVTFSKQNKTLNNYVNEITTKLSSYQHDSFYNDVSVTEVGTAKTKSGLDVRVIEANYSQGSYQPDIIDKWYIAVDLKNDQLLTIEVEAENKVMSLDSIEELYKNVNIEEKKAIILNTKVDGDYQVGTLIQNKKKTHDTGYKVHLKVPKKYPEVETTSSDYYSSVFEIESVYEHVYSWITLEVDTLNKSFQEKLEDEKKYSIQSYTENKETYRNIKQQDITKKTINGKEVYYYIFSFDYYLKDAKEKSHTGYLSEIFYEIEPNFYYKVYLSTKNIEINEALISDFLNFTVEEY